MKVLIIDNLAVASSRRYLYRSLAKQLCETVYLLVPESWREQGVVTNCEPETCNDLKIYSSPFLFGYRHQRIVYTKLKKVIAQVKPDIIYISSEPENFNTFQLVAIVKLLYPKIKIVCATWRNIDYRKNPFPYKLGWINRLIENFNKKRIDVCFAHSRTAETLMKQLANWKVYYLPPAINLDDFKFRPKTAVETKNKFVVGYIGRLSQEKGVDILIKALRMCNDKVCGYIIGDGSEKSNLKSLAKKIGIEEKIKWQDAVEYKSVADTLQNFDVLVLPSRTTKIWKEQFGRVLIEAMAVGVPVIGAKSGEIPNVIGDCGLLFEEGNVDELAKAIKTLEDWDLQKVLIKCGREKVTRDFSADSTVAILLETFQKLIRHEKH